MAFELYATRQYSLATLRDALLKRGLSRRGKALHPNSLADLLHNPFYAGIIRIKRSGQTFAGTHEPLIGIDLFNRVQAVLKGKNIETVQRHDFLFRRLLRCRHCATTLIGERQKGIAYYRCHTRGCETKCIREDVVLKQLLASLACLNFGEHEAIELQRCLDEDGDEQAKMFDATLRSTRLRVAAIEEREQRLLDAYLDQVIGQDEYERKRATVHLELAEARGALDEIDRVHTGFALTAQRFFEFARLLNYEQVRADAALFREAVREATSNLVVAGKNLCVSMKSPFRELSAQLTICFGGPSQGRPRTDSTIIPLQRASPLRSKREYRRIARILRTHLTGWQPPAFILEAEKRRAPTPQWKKNLRKQKKGDDWACEAA
jgi:hypothetical protein